MLEWKCCSNVSRIVEALNLRVPTSLTKVGSPPQYKIVDLNLLENLITKLACLLCSSNVSFSKSITNKLLFKYTVSCNCGFTTTSQSSPKIPNKSDDDMSIVYDINQRLSSTAQIVGLKYKQMSEFLNLLGVGCISGSTWQRISNTVFHAVESVATDSMKKSFLDAKINQDLWIIVDCRWELSFCFISKPFLLHFSKIILIPNPSIPREVPS